MMKGFTFNKLKLTDVLSLRMTYACMISLKNKKRCCGKVFLKPAAHVMTDIWMQLFALSIYCFVFTFASLFLPFIQNVEKYLYFCNILQPHTLPIQTGYLVIDIHLLRKKFLIPLLVLLNWILLTLLFAK